MGIIKTDNYVFLNAVTASVANTAASKYDVSKGQIKSIQFTCSGQTSGNGVFGVEVSNDGTNWVVYSRLIPNLTGTNSQTDASVAAPTLSSNISAIYFFPLSDYFRYMRVFVAVTTDGAYSAVAEIGG
jgi:hypothetical protein